MRKSGSLVTYLRKLKRGLDRENVEVPCGDCRACCTDPELEVDVTEQERHVYKCHKHPEFDRWVLDRNEDGSCVYFRDGNCSVYADRPRTCRVYDCRYHMFGAPLAPECKHVTAAVAEWEKFTTPTQEDKVALVALSMLLEEYSKRIPSMIGLAFVLVQWEKLRSIAWDKVQELDNG